MMTPWRGGWAAGGCGPAAGRRCRVAVMLGVFGPDRRDGSARAGGLSASKEGCAAAPVRVPPFSGGVGLRFGGLRGCAFGIDTPGRCGLNWAAITVESLEMAFQVVAGLPGHGLDRSGLRPLGSRDAGFPVAVGPNEAGRSRGSGSG